MSNIRFVTSNTIVLSSGEDCKQPCLVITALSLAVEHAEG